MFVTQMTNTNPQYIQFFDEWTLDVDGEKEDCIKETMEWFSEYGTQQISKG